MQFRPRLEVFADWLLMRCRHQVSLKSTGCRLAHASARSATTSARIARRHQRGRVGGLRVTGFTGLVTQVEHLFTRKLKSCCDRTLLIATAELDEIVDLQLESPKQRPVAAGDCAPQSVDLPC